MPDYELEKMAIAAGAGIVAGIDEAGRGPWAGPVIAAAVVLDMAALPKTMIAAIDDSKKLTAGKREMLFAALPSYARIGVGRAEVAEIDATNILAAALTAMARAVDALGLPPDVALVDGNRPPKLRCPVECVVKGDGRSLSIAAASIVAKVARDREMAELANAFPGYGWERNAGYGTAQHQAALAALGLTPHHRRSFAPIRRLIKAATS